MFETKKDYNETEMRTLIELLYGSIAIKELVLRSKIFLWWGDSHSSKTCFYSVYWTESEIRPLRTHQTSHLYHQRSLHVGELDPQTHPQLQLDPVANILGHHHQNWLFCH